MQGCGFLPPRVLKRGNDGGWFDRLTMYQD